MTKIDIGSEIKRGWELFMAPGNMVLLILVTLVAALLTLFSCLILAGPMVAGVFLIIQRLLKNDPEKPKVGDIFKGFDYFLNTFLFLLAGFCIGAVLMLIPVLGQISGLILGELLSIGLMLIVFKKMSFVDALKKLVEGISTGPFWMLVLTLFIANIISSLGAIACLVGVLFTAPLAACIMVCAYNTAYGDTTPVPAPALPQPEEEP